MAKIIEFHIPKSFSTRAESLPPSKLGKLLEFPIRNETREISAASAQCTAFAQNAASPALLDASPFQKVECALLSSPTYYGFSDL